jgi:hypothetical protein
MELGPAIAANTLDQRSKRGGEPVEKALTIIAFDAMH